MENNTDLPESLLVRVSDYGKTSFELIWLKMIDKITDVVSSLAPKSVVFILFATLMLFWSPGIAFWLGIYLLNYLGNFFAAGAFYILAGNYIDLNGISGFASKYDTNE